MERKPAGLKCCKVLQQQKLHFLGNLKLLIKWVWWSSLPFHPPTWKIQKLFDRVLKSLISLLLWTKIRMRVSLRAMESVWYTVIKKHRMLLHWFRMRCDAMRCDAVGVGQCEEWMHSRKLLPPPSVDIGTVCVFSIKVTSSVEPVLWSCMRVCTLFEPPAGKRPEITNKSGKNAAGAENDHPSKFLSLLQCSLK